MTVDLYRSKRAAFCDGGTEHVLRLPEVAVAQASPLTRFASPRTAWVHVHTPEGLLDVSRFRHASDSLYFGLGLGFELAVPDLVLDRVRVLEYGSLQYRAGPPELAYLPKAVWALMRQRDTGTSESRTTTQDDLTRLPSILDRGFLKQLLERGGVRWLGRPLPDTLKRQLDPFGRAEEILALFDRGER
ncbi:MAG: hypothetical protein L0271_25700 [Gemmatimonadetes bacterium]|nr:hypothetical protein [Gemmatimonadota bacterium]